VSVLAKGIVDLQRIMVSREVKMDASVKLNKTLVN